MAQGSAREKTAALSEKPLKVDLTVAKRSPNQERGGGR
jgi:hypothetical protein